MNAWCCNRYLHFWKVPVQPRELQVHQVKFLNKRVTMHVILWERRVNKIHAGTIARPSHPSWESRLFKKTIKITCMLNICNSRIICTIFWSFKRNVLKKLAKEKSLLILKPLLVGVIHSLICKLNFRRKNANHYLVHSRQSRWPKSLQN